MSNRKLFIALTAGIFFLSLISCAFIMTKRGGRTVVISQDGKELFRLDLDREPDRRIEVEYEGRKNVIEIKDGEIYMMTADCPDHVCIKTGRLEYGKPVVCLPNRLVIEFDDGGALDGTAG
jgi:hypothetical protein